MAEAKNLQDFWEILKNAAPIISPVVGEIVVLNENNIKTYLTNKQNNIIETEIKRIYWT